MYCDNPQRIYNKYLERFILVPCGRCDSCRITRSNALSSRCWNECQNHKYNLFCTLTYDNDNVPFITSACDKVQTKNKRLDLDFSHLDEKFQKSLLDIRHDYPNVPLTNHGVDTAVGVLWKKDLQDFLKRLRSKIYYEFKQRFEKEILSKKTKFMYFACGEMGTDYKRPHFHLILHFDTEEVAEFARVSILSCWKLCDWDTLEAFAVRQGKTMLPSYVGGIAAAKYVSAYVSVLGSSSNSVERSNFRPFVTFSKNPLYGCSSSDKDILRDFISGEYDSEVCRELQYISNGELCTTNVIFSQNFLRSLFPRFNGIDALSFTDKFRLCLFDSRNKQKHAFFTKCRTFCKKYLGGFTESAIMSYLEIYERLTNRVKSYLLQDFMSKFRKNNPLEYIKSCYHTFEDDPNRLFFTIKINILENFGIDLFKHPLSVYDFGSTYLSQLKQRKFDYASRLLPKHFNNKRLNHLCYV